MNFITENGLIFYVTPGKKIALPNNGNAAKAIVCKNKQDIEDVLIGMHKLSLEGAKEAIENIQFSLACNHPLCMGDFAEFEKHFNAYL